MAFTEKMAVRTYTSGSAIVQFTFVSLAADGQVDNTSANARTDGVALMAAVGANEAIAVADDAVETFTDAVTSSEDLTSAFTEE